MHIGGFCPAAQCQHICSRADSGIVLHVLHPLAAEMLFEDEVTPRPRHESRAHTLRTDNGTDRVVTVLNCDMLCLAVMPVNSFQAGRLASHLNRGATSPPSCRFSRLPQERGLGWF